jgi:hypothetical protein
MAKIELSNDQLHLIQKALDFYSRIGIGQFWVIKEHPTFEEFLRDAFRIKTGPIEVGDKTERGIVVEIGPKRKWIKTKGSWGNGEEIKKWDDPEKIKHSVDYSRYHAVRDTIDSILTQPRNMLIQDTSMGQHGSWGIHHPKVDDSCREAFDLIQVIRHEFWKANPNSSSITVDSHIHFTSSKNMNGVKVEIDPIT